MPNGDDYHIPTLAEMREIVTRTDAEREAWLRIEERVGSAAVVTVPKYNTQQFGGIVCASKLFPAHFHLSITSIYVYIGKRCRKVHGPILCSATMPQNNELFPVQTMELYDALQKDEAAVLRLAYYGFNHNVTIYDVLTDLFGNDNF